MGPGQVVIVLARRYLEMLTLILAFPDTTFPPLSSVLVPFSSSRPVFSSQGSHVFEHCEASRFRSATPRRPQLTAHTEGASALAERLFHGKVTQKDYDVPIYSTTMISMDRVTAVPITFTLNDSLTTLTAHAHQNLKIPLAKVETIKLCV